MLSFTSIDTPALVRGGVSETGTSPFRCRRKIPFFVRRPRPIRLQPMSGNGEQEPNENVDREKLRSFSMGRWSEISSVSFLNNIPSTVRWGSLWVLYGYTLLFSQVVPGHNVFSGTEDVSLALDLSWNFMFVQPLFQPERAPVSPPTLEALFNLVALYGTLWFGFLPDGRRQKGVSMMSFLLGTLFLTNLFWLPYMALREPYSLSQDHSREDPPPLPSWSAPLEQGKVFPLVILTLAAICVAWMLYGRADVYPGAGDFGLRWDQLTHLVGSGRLAFSLALDVVIFALCQGIMVDDDMARLGMDNENVKLVGRWVPFLGLIYYFWKRAEFLEGKD
mmetsp:Transcript_13652/g.27972  ORF Transcript_13652/g.27972 Transcript_13652/m.27972 type:complete len:334 (-) Transcript_13652:851-1852(-)